MKKIWQAVKKYLSETDLFLHVCILISSGYGLLLIYSATYSYGTDRNVLVQLLGIFLGYGCLIVLSLFDYEHLAGFSKYIWVACVLGLLAVFFFGTGLEETGNINWIRFGNLGIQPSEIVKIGFILTFAAHLNAIRERVNSPKNILLLVLHMAVPVSLIVLQHDAGSALVFVFIFAVMCFGAGVSLWYFLGVGVLGVASLPFVWNFLKPYQQGRILAGFNPEIDPSGYGYQAYQSKIAIGSGQMYGNGFLQGLQTQNNVLPAKHTDFIFGVAGEEFGFFGSLLIIALLLLMIIRCIHIARVSRSELGSFICMGVAAMLIFQTFENIGMCMGVLPVIGITLPFFSYGGSSILGVMLGMGLVTSVYTRRKYINFNA